MSDTVKRKPGRPKKSAASGSVALVGNTDHNISEPVKRKRGRPKGTKNKSIRPDHSIKTEPGENTKFILHDMKLMKLPKIDYNNLEQVKNRIDDYISICADDDIKPSVASLALCFGVSRITLFNWMTGKTETVKNKECLNTIKGMYDMINSYYEHMMNNGKINPVAGIFLMKNNMGYKDTTDHIITANTDNSIALQDITDRAGLLD